MNLDWKSVRPYNGSRSMGFEQLCAQLAQADSPAGSRFIRKGPPDAGVECYTILSDGSEWGWQSKYFDALGDSQWSQVDDSVKTAIEKHPRLVKYFVCIPLDRPDARIEGRKSAMERWDEHVEKWIGWATDKKMTVEFVYWGSHELTERLTRIENVGRVRFWFDVRLFDKAWFSARLEEALKAAGPRYTPEIHVDLPIASEFEAFGRTNGFFSSIKARARTIRNTLRNTGYSEPGEGLATLSAAIATMSTPVQAVINELSSIETQPIGLLPFNGIAEKVIAAITAVEELEKFLIQREKETNTEEKTDTEATPSSYRSNPYRDRRDRLYSLFSELRQAHASLIHAKDIAGNTLMILRGDAGMGNPQPGHYPDWHTWMPK